VYIEDKTDLQKLADSAHLIFGPQHPARRAKKVCGMYFLYPTAFEENCIPNFETGEDHGAALVDQRSLFRMIASVERAGIPTKFPHSSNLYEQLTSKKWTHLLAVVAPHLRIPATIAVPRMLIEHNIEEAAHKAMESLVACRREQAELRGEKAPEGDTIAKGVAKLGHSWEALDVKFWEGQKGFESALSQLTYAIEISDEMTGQPHDLDALIVSEYIQHDLELRIYVVDGEPEYMIYTKFCRIKDNLEFGDFKQLSSRTEAAKQWVGGDVAALEDGEKQCKVITKHWLSWLRAQACEAPPAIRFDYFIGRKPGCAGQANVWTLEICELGFSMLGDRKLPPKVFKSMLRHCVASLGSEDDSSQERGGAKRNIANGATAASRRRRKNGGGKGGKGSGDDGAEEDGGAEAEA